MVLHNLLLVTTFHSPLIRSIVPCVIAGLGCQALTGLASILFVNGYIHDLSRSLTLLAMGTLSLYLPALRTRATLAASGAAYNALPPLPGPIEMVRSVGSIGTEQGVGARDWRQVGLTALVVIWAIRLVCGPFSRISAIGNQDLRFEDMRSKPSRFTLFWCVQTLLLTMQMLPVLALNAVPARIVATTRIKTTPLALLGMGLWAMGFLFEVMATAQKSAWLRAKMKKMHDEEFLTRGLFGISRYPNYLGEMVFWMGIATTAASILARQAVQLSLGFSGDMSGIALTTALCAVSPAFNSWYQLHITGILRNEVFEHRADYQRWKKETSLLIPKNN